MDFRRVLFRSRVGEVEERVVRDPQDHGPCGRERAPEELPPLLVGRQTLRQALLHSGSRSPSLDSATIVSCSERGKVESKREGQMKVASIRETLLAATLIAARSEEHTSELQSLMRISYAGLLLKKNNTNNYKH